MPAPQTLRRLRRIAFVLLLPASLFGCDEAPDLPPPEGLSCEVTGAPIGARCDGADDCPCGQYCDLGRCTEDCVADADCYDGQCSAFGQCTSNLDLPLVDFASAGDLRLASTLLDLEQGTPGNLVIDADGPATRVRAIAGDGVELDCESDRIGDCVLTVPENSRLEVPVRLTEGGPDASAITLVFPGGIRTVGVRRGSSHTVPGSETSFSGHYVGTLSLDGAAFESGELPSEPSRSLSWPVQVAIQHSSGEATAALSLSDTVLFGDSPWRGTLTFVGGNFEEPEVQMSDRVVWESTTDGGRPVGAKLASARATATARLQRARAGRETTALSLDIPLHADLLLAEGEAPAATARLRLRLAQSDHVAIELPEEVPAAPLTAAPSSTPSVHMAWVDSSLPPVPSGTALLASLAPSGPENLGACNATPTEIASAVAELTRATWGPSSGLWTHNLLGVPCQLRHTGDGTSRTHCDDLRSDYSCTITTPPSSAPEFQTGGQRYEVERTCVFRNEARCTEGLLCTGDGRQGSALSPEIAGRWHGDLGCTTGNNVASIALDVSVGLTDTPATELLGHCAAELQEFHTSAPGIAGSPENIASLFNTPRCISGARTLATALRGMNSDHARDQRVALRQLQRWVQLHRTLALEAEQAEAMAAVERSLGNDYPLAEERLGLVNQGWALLVHPSVHEAELNLSTETVALPDYRTRIEGFSGGSPNDASSLGLPVVLLELATAQQALAQTVLRQSWHASAMAAPEVYNDAIASTFLGAVLAEAWSQRARSARESEGRSAPSWDARYAQLLTELNSAFQVTLDVGRRFEAGENPLGIDDTDVPLYFSGDLQGPAARFGAVSSHLLEGAFSAPELVAGASEAFEQARRAWTFQQNRQFVRSSDEANAVGVLTDFGEKLEALCGLPDDLDTEHAVNDWTTFDPQRCFIHERAECNRSEEELLRDDLNRNADATGLLNVMCRLDETGTHGLNTAFFEDPPDAASCTISFPERSPMELRCSGRQALRIRPRELRAGASASPTPRCSHHYPGYDDWPGSRLDLDSSCYRGSIGEQRATIHALSLEVQTSIARTHERLEEHSRAIEGCQLITEYDPANDDRLKNYASQISRTRSQIATFSSFSAIAGAVATCASAGGETWGFAGTTAVTCSAAGAQASFDVISINLEAKLQELQSDYDSRVAELARQERYASCMHEAEGTLVGLQSLGAETRRRIADLEAAYVAYLNQIQQARSTMARARSTVDAIADRQTISPEHDYWLDERIQTFLRRQRLAQRATYLAVRAAEYEYQSSLPLRAPVLAAQTPEELRAVLEEVQTVVATGRVLGNAPTDLKVIFSLRDDILRLGDRSDGADGHGLSPEQRFAIAATSRPVRNDAGEVIAFEVPFTLSPDGVSGAEGDGVLPTNDCAERLWSIGASILGERLQASYRGSFARLELRKGRSFSSQSCDGSGLQSHAFDPTQNLFREPELGTEFSPSLNESSAYSTARIEAYIGAPRIEFEQDSYSEGASTELAAQGLYGEYALILPTDLFEGSGDERRFRGEDVLLRLDYVSVSQ